jgi:EAL domain-containing protein (putative c-di-GMP-specific phosphodiesterase class I)
MYQAKRSGKNGWAAFHSDPQRSQAESARVNWNTRIHRALRDQRFVLHFQSVHRAADLRVAHHEALVRMVDENDPSLVISPAEFIAHAERSGKIQQIDRWVFETCVAQLASSGPAVCIAANLSARSLEDSSFPGFLRGLLQRSDVDPRRLHIELTETSAISDPLVARQLIDTLRGLGCAVHLDDFGSGFSSFAHLKLLDVDAIKIDGVFIRNLQSDSSNRLFVASMIEIAHNLNKTVVAEHVEDAGTLEILRGLGVDMVQGFHLARPSAQLMDVRPRGHLQVVADFRRSTRGDVG